MLLGCVGGHHAGGARVADRHQPPAARLPALQIEIRGVHEAADVRHAVDAVLAEERVDDAVFRGQRAGVRAGCGGAARRDARLERDDGQAALACNLRSACELVRIGDGFEVEQQQLDLGIERHG